MPWKPSTKHRGYKLRTHIDEDDDERIEGGSDDDDEDEINMEVYQEDDSTETAEEVAKQQEVIFSRIGETYGFYIKARDIAKYGPTPGCPGCKHITGEVSTQCGHTKECKGIIMDAMEKDKDDTHRVRQWYVAKEIYENKYHVESAEMETEEQKDSATTTTSSSRARQEGPKEETSTKRPKTDGSSSSSSS